MTRQMAMVGFLQAQNLHQPAELMGVIPNRATIRCRRNYQEIAGILEAGKFHMAFVDDRLAMPDRYGNDHQVSPARA